MVKVTTVGKYVQRIWLFTLKDNINLLLSNATMQLGGSESEGFAQMGAAVQYYKLTGPLRQPG